MACRSTGRWRTCLATPCSSLRTARGNGESLNIHLSLRPNFLLVWQVRSETRVRFGQEPRDGILTRCSVESQRFFQTPNSVNEPVLSCWVDQKMISHVKYEGGRKEEHILFGFLFLPSCMYETFQTVSSPWANARNQPVPQVGRCWPSSLFSVTWFFPTHQGFSCCQNSCLLSPSSPGHTWGGSAQLDRSDS